ncbi:MAG: glycosyltransferase family 4 protein [Elusimicrobiota bacterium]|nr:MAG: glycosyltransferase family 4 protein [Elusimicrobiota bacterium]
MIVRALAEADKTNEYVLFGAFWSRPERLAELDLPKQANFRTLQLKAPQRLLLPAEEFLGIRWQEKKLLELGVDLVHGFSNWLPRLEKLPSIMTLAYAEHTAFTRWDEFYFNRLLPRSVRQADKILSISGTAKDAAVRDFGADPKKIDVVYYGAPLDGFEPAGGPASPPYFLFVGVTRSTKNTKVLMEGFVRFKKSHPEAPHRFVICGAPGDEQEELEKLLAGAGLTEAVTFAGNVAQKDVHPYYQKALAYVSASALEGFHLPLIEAMACGIPTVAARGGAQTEIVADAGLHVDATAEDLARGMEAVAFDEPLRARLREKGFARCREFSWSRAARQVIAAYEAVLARPR